MKRLMTLFLALTLAAVVFGPGQRAAASWGGIEYFYDFNVSLAPFQLFADNALPSTTDAVSLHLSHSCYAGDSAVGGDGLDNGCALLTNNHTARFVTMMAPLWGHGTGINVGFTARDLGGCARCAPIVYVGSGKPLDIGSFQMVGPPLTGQWTYYEYTALLDGASPVIAVGIVNLDDGRAMQHAGIDNLRVRFLDD